jgi:flagellar basal body rod protein FlgC
MSIASSIAISGVAAATLQLDQAARYVANASSSALASASDRGRPDSVASEQTQAVQIDVSSDPSGRVKHIPPNYIVSHSGPPIFSENTGSIACPILDQPSAVLSAIQAKYLFAANVQVLKVDNQLTRQTIDIAA